jgi:Subtilase family/FG-GAP-like repeat
MCAHRPCDSARKVIYRFCAVAILCIAVALTQAHSQSGANLLSIARQLRVHSQQGTSERISGEKYLPDRLLVRFKNGTSADVKAAIHRAVSAQVLRELPIVRGLQLVKIAEGKSVPEMLHYYRRNSNVVYAEPDYIVHAFDTPNDPQFSSQWNLQNTGQNGGTPGADIHATQAWNLSTGSSNVVVGVLDTGLDYDHQDLSANVWSAPTAFSVGEGETAVPCAAGTHGFNAVAASCDPMDDNGHGTHVSGTIGAVGNNGIGVAGINWQVQLLPCKFLDSTGSGSTANAIVCLSLMEQLKESGVNIVVTNNSWGGTDSSQALYDAIAAAMQDGILFVAAAGNDFSDNDQFPEYPASFYLPNIIAVAASDRNDNLVTFSNTGKHTVHIAAPGRDILSTLPGNSYGLDSGTSMATPHVTGVAALLSAQNASLDWRSIKNSILAGGDTLAAFQNTITGKRLDANGAMTCTSASVASRLLPVPNTISGSVGSPVNLGFLNIQCGQPAGQVTAVVTPGNQSITLTDDGTGSDLVANDGIYSGQWLPSATGSYSLAFPDGSTVEVEVLTPYGYSQTSFNYQTISGTNLDLSDDGVATVSSPFPISFGGGSFTSLYVSSNGTISFTDQFDSYQNFALGPTEVVDEQVYPTTLIAPLWEDLYPVKGSNQNVFWSVTGTAPNRKLVVEWRNVLAFACRNDSGTNVTFQVVFQEGSSNVVFNYDNVVFGGACSYLDYGQYAITGLQSSPTQGVMWNDGSAPALSNGLALLWQTPPPTGSSSPLPSVTSISPSAVPMFSPDTPITVTGSNFVPASVVQWQNTNLAPLPAPLDLPTTYVSSTQLNAVIPSAFSQPNNRYIVGTVQSILVSNPAPGGGLSNTVPISIVYPGVPSITSLSPSSATAGDFSLTMNVTGNNLWGAVIYWNGQMLTTTNVGSNTQVSVAVPSTLLTIAGTAQITAVANVPNGGTSGPVTFTINSLTASVSLSALTLTPQARLQRSVDTRGLTIAGTPARIQSPGRFLGWNYGRQEGGPAYLKYFSRPYQGPAIQPSVSSLLSGPSNTANPQLSLFQPSSLPGFAFLPTNPAGYLPTSVATGDFNGDGKTDWVVSNGGSNDLWVYFGNGDGTAQLPQIVALTGAAPLQVVAADLRKTGVLDLVVAEADTQTIGVLLGNGDGTFQAETTYFVQGPPLSLGVADVNGDGKLDIVAGISGTIPLVTLLGDGTGKFGPPVGSESFNSLATFSTSALVLKDLNGDGFPDVTLVDDGTLVAGAHSYINNGDGTFKHSSFFFESAPPILVTSVAVADVNGDGCPDAVTVEALGLARVFNGSCDGSFQTFPNVLTLGAGEAPVSVALADINGDGNADIVTGGGYFGVGDYGEEATNLVTVLLGDGKGNFSLPSVYRTEPNLYGLAVADLNGDGKPEVIVASQSTDTAIVLLNDGQGNLNGPTGSYVGYITAQGDQLDSVNAPYGGFMVQDLNGDGKPDLAVIEVPPKGSSPWSLATLLNDGTGHFGSFSRVPVADEGNGPTGYAFGDFRNTGRPDFIAWENFQGNPSIVYLPNNGSGQFGRHQVTSFNPNQLGTAGLLAVGDFNGDGKLDFVLITGVPGSNGLQLVFFEGNGDGTFQMGSSASLNTTTPPFMIFVGDYNRDGKLDVLIWVYDNVVGTTNHNVYEFLGNGDGTFAPAKLILPNFGFFGMADVNNDGYPDIVEFDETPSTTASGWDAANFTIFLGQSDGTFTQGQTYSPYAGAVQPTFGYSNVGSAQILTPMLADFNGDGNVDIGVVMSTYYPAPGAYMQVLAGNGDGTFTPTYEIIPFNKAGAPTNAADVNGDGRADLLELDGWPSSFNVTFGTSGATVQPVFVSQPVVGNVGALSLNLSLLSASATTVQLSASDPNVVISPSVTIPAGTLSSVVPFTLGPNFKAAHVFSISAQVGGQTSTVYSYQAPSSLAGVRLFTNRSSELTPAGGTTPDYAIGLVSMGGYSATVQLSCQGLPAGSSCVFGTNPLVLTAGQSIGSSLMVQTSASTPYGPYTFTVVASDGFVSDQMTLQLNVADFSLSVTPRSVSALPGTNANFTLQLTTFGSWPGALSVGCTLSGVGVSQPCGTLGPYTAGNYPFSVTTTGLAAGSYTVQVGANDNGIVHVATATLLIEGVTASVSPTTATINVGGSANFNVILTSAYGYTNQFTFGCVNPPAGVSCSFSPPSGTLPAGGTINSTLTVKITSQVSSLAGTRGPVRSDSRRPEVPIAPIAFVAVLAALLAYLMARLSYTSTWQVATRTLFAVGLILCGFCVGSCGGGSGGGGNSGGGGPSGGGSPPPPSTPVNVVLAIQATSANVSVTAGTITIATQ